MKIVVTGGAGFIGSHIVDAYVARGHRVVILDNLSTGSKSNIHPKAVLRRADIRSLSQLQKVFLEEKPDVVNHHAAFISVTESVKKPAFTFETNVRGTLHVLLAFGAIPKRRKRLIFSSTGGAIYGDPKKLPAPETTPAHPFSPYALSKVLDEELIRFHATQSGITYIILRYANVYGPRQRAQGGAGIFPIFSRLMQKGIRPTIFGNGKKTRDYVYVKDVARASVLALTRGKDDIINIGSGKETSDRAVFDEIARQFHFKQEPRYAPIRKGEVVRIALDRRKAKKILRWEPSTPLKQGIGELIHSLRYR